MLDIADQYTLSLKMKGILSPVYKLSTHRVERQDPSLQMAQHVSNGCSVHSESSVVSGYIHIFSQCSPLSLIYFAVHFSYVHLVSSA